MADLLDEYEARTGHWVPIHVDAASGGFVAPFATPALEWDFRIPRVVSINTSGHKFGLSYVGVGWAVWRSKEFLPKDFIFELHYLGSVEYSFSLNYHQAYYSHRRDSQLCQESLGKDGPSLGTPASCPQPSGAGCRAGP